jgi:hypothetical protein
LQAKHQPRRKSSAKKNLKIFLATRASAAIIEVNKVNNGVNGIAAEHRLERSAIYVP